MCRRANVRLARVCTLAAVWSGLAVGCDGSSGSGSGGEEGSVRAQWLEVGVSKVRQGRQAGQDRTGQGSRPARDDQRTPAGRSSVDGGWMGI